MMRVALPVALMVGLSGCYTAGDPEVFKCSDKKPGCPGGYQCHPTKKVCVEDGAKLDGSVDGSITDTTKGKDATADRGHDQQIKLDTLLPDLKQWTCLG